MKFDGDNFRLKVCFTWDNPQTTGQDPSGWNACVGGDVADPNVLTVWRKVWVWVNAMDHPSDHQPRCTDQGTKMETPENPLSITTSWNGETIPGAYDDAFIEMNIQQKRQDTDFEFDLDALQFHGYSRDHTDFPNPHPVHTAQLMGLHAISGCPQGSLGETLRFNLDVHSGVSVENIWGQGNKPYGPAELKTAIHELGHNLRFDWENGDCINNPSDMDVMTQNWCSVDLTPPRWFNLGHLKDLREYTRR